MLNKLGDILGQIYVCLFTKQKRCYIIAINKGKDLFVCHYREFVDNIFTSSLPLLFIKRK